MIALCAVLLALGASPGDVSGPAVLDSLVRVLEQPDDYTVRLAIEVDVERISVAPMEATLYYKRPDRVHIEADGVAMIPREVLPTSIAELPKTFTVQDSRRDSIGGREMIRLSLEPRAATTRTRRVSLLVDPRTWLPQELSSVRVDGRSITASFSFERVERFWLPSQVLIHLEAAAEDSSESSNWEQHSRGGTRASMPRRGTVRILYQDYKVNTGLPDELFGPQREGTGGRPRGE